MATHGRSASATTFKWRVDAKDKLIVGAGGDQPGRGMGLLTQAGTSPRESIGTIDVVADRGYFKIEDIEGMRAGGHVPHVAETAMRLVDARGHVSQGRVPRYDAGLETDITDRPGSC